MALLSRTVEQKTNSQGFPKPGELIEMTGTHVLEASDRAVLNLLYQHAHDSGKLLEENAEWEIPLATVRQAFSKHESSDRLRDTLNRLMTVKVNVAYVAESVDKTEGPEQRVVITGQPNSECRLKQPAVGLRRARSPRLFAPNLSWA